MPIKCSRCNRTQPSKFFIDKRIARFDPSNPRHFNSTCEDCRSRYYETESESEYETDSETYSESESETESLSDSESDVEPEPEEMNQFCQNILKRTGLTLEKFASFEKIRKSGIINMLDSRIPMLANITKSEHIAIISLTNIEYDLLVKQLN